MALIPHRSFSPFRDFFDDDFLAPTGRTLRGTDLAIDVYEEDENVVAEMNLPGIDPDNVEVNLNKGRLAVSGQYEEEEEKEEKNYTYRERRAGTFSRTVRLPSTVDEESTKAQYTDGVLKITMPKQEKAEKTGTNIKIDRS